MIWILLFVAENHRKQRTGAFETVSDKFANKRLFESRNSSQGFLRFQIEMLPNKKKGET